MERLINLCRLIFEELFNMERASEEFDTAQAYGFHLVSSEKEFATLSSIVQLACPSITKTVEIRCLNFQRFPY